MVLVLRDEVILKPRSNEVVVFEAGLGLPSSAPLPERTCFLASSARGSLADAAARSRREMSQQAVPLKPGCCSLPLASNGALREKTATTAAAMWESLAGPKPWMKKLLLPVQAHNPSRTKLSRPEKLKKLMLAFLQIRLPTKRKGKPATLQPDSLYL
ncbi:hypothetical protein GUJ93_ZPchr0004g39645 [Zizania palustris]|uniref:Uncharacterized protein n=1 Tax=Zizania palustris TaxID=103762 RepID=A0A8J5VG63_ZIZPA|nr:hypothetical protein GUJ93_ZPchr0004g39645 [Zizania palustris]